MLEAFLRGAALGGVVFLCIGCGGRADDGASAPASDSAVPGGDAPAVPPTTNPTLPEPVPAPVTPPGGMPSNTTASTRTCSDRPLADYCAMSPACSYAQVEEDPYIAGYAALLEARCRPPMSDAGNGASCATSIADISCTCTTSSSGASYTLVNLDTGFTSLSLYYANGDTGPGALVSAVMGTDDCDECGCATYFGERVDCACPYDPGSGGDGLPDL